MADINALIAQGRPAPTWDYTTHQMNALKLLGERRKAAQYPEELNNLRFTRQVAAAEKMIDEFANIDLARYSAFKQYWEANGVRPGLLPDVSIFGNDEAKFKKWHAENVPMSKSSLEELRAQASIATATKPVSVRPGGALVSPTTGQPIYTAPPEPEKPKEGEFERLVKSYNGMLPNDPNKTLYLARIKKMSETTGFKINVDKDGNIEIVQGPIGAEGLTKTMETKVQEKLFNAQEQLSRVKTIEDMFKPEYQKITTRGRAWWSGIKAKWGADLSKEETADLTDFAGYKRRAISNINLYIKEITGAQMSELEADRLRQGMPDPGEGIFGGDDPVSFKSKLNDILKEVKASIHRYEKLLKNGFTPEQISKMAKTDSLPDLRKSYSIEVPQTSLELSVEEEKYAREQLQKRGVKAKDEIGDEIIKMRRGK